MQINWSGLLQPMGGFSVLFGSFLQPKIEENLRQGVLYEYEGNLIAIQTLQNAYTQNLSFWQSHLTFIFLVIGVFLFTSTYLILVK